MTVPNDPTVENALTDDLVQAAEPEGPDVTEVVDTLVDRLRAVRSTYERQVQAETALASERDQIDTARDELQQRQAELAALRQEIANQGEAIERNSAEAKRRQSALAKLEQDIQQRTADVARREREASSKQAALREEREHLEALKAEVDEDRKNLVLRASELEKREADLTKQAAEAISGEDQAHHRQLLARFEAERQALEPKIKEIEETALKTQRELEAKLETLLAKSAEREGELAGRLEEQEKVARDLRSQLEITSRRHKREMEEKIAEQARFSKPRPTFSERVDGQAARRVGIWIAWAAAVAFLGYGGYHLWSTGDAGPMAVLFGLAFASIYFGSQALGRRLTFPPAIAVGLLGLTSGIWLPAWIETCQVAAATWELPMDSLPSFLAPAAPMAFAVLTGCLLMGLALLICTSSWAVAAYVTVASVIAAGLMLLPDPTGSMRYVAALLWLTLVGTALSQWGMAHSERTGIRLKAA